MSQHQSVMEDRWSPRELRKYTPSLRGCCKLLLPHESFRPKGRCCSFLRVAFTASCGAQGGLGPAAGTQMFSGLQPLIAGTADGGHDCLWSPAGRSDLTYSVWGSSGASHLCPLRSPHTWSSMEGQGIGHKLLPTSSIFNIAQESLHGGSPASGGHPHCPPTFTTCHFELHPHLLTGQPRLPALTVSSWSQLPALAGSASSLSSPCPTLLYQGWMTHIVHQTGSRITRETNLWEGLLSRDNPA